MKDRIKRLRTSGRLYAGLAWTVLAALIVGSVFAIGAAPVPAQDGAPLYIYSSARYTPAGNAVLKVPTSDNAGRGSIGLRNEDATYDVYVKFVANGATAPTTTTVLDTPYKLSPGQAFVYSFNSNFDVYVMNSQGGATTSNLYVEEYQGGEGGSGSIGGNAATISGSITSDSELPAAETPADNLTNATAAPRVNGLGYVFDGTAWDRQPGTTADGTLVNLGANNDVGINAGTNLIGRVSASSETTNIYEGTTALTPKFKVIDHAVSGDNELVAAVASKKIRVLGGLLIASAAVNARFESGAGGTALTGVMNLAANAGFQIPYIPVGNFETAANTALNLELSGAVSVDGWIVYIEVS